VTAVARVLRPEPWLRVSPDASLLVAVGVWVIAAAASVPFPVLEPAVSVAAFVIVGAIMLDAIWLLRTPRLELTRSAPERLEVGRGAELEIEVTNPGSRRVVADVYDELPRDLAGEDPSFPASWFEPGASRTLRYRVSPRVRGDRAFGPMAALARSPLGLLRRRVLAGAGESVRVHPDTSRFLLNAVLSPKQVLASLGVKPSRQRGGGTEFESLRDYVAGDDPRRIDWRATARRGRLVTRLHQHERNHTVVIAVDASRLMGGRVRGDDRTKLDCAVDSALALAWSALHAGDRAGLIVFDRERRLFLEPLAKRVHLGAFVEALSPVQSRLVEADYGVLARSLLGRRQKRSLVVILTDFAETDPESLVTPMALLARHHQVLLVALRDHRFDVLDPRRGQAAPEERRRLLGGSRNRDSFYERIVLDDLLREREETLGRLRLRGVRTLDLVSEEVTSAVLNRYLAMRYEGVV
jgi:uncharacterized protein (DUF58 family)